MRTGDDDAKTLFRGWQFFSLASVNCQHLGVLAVEAPFRHLFKIAMIGSGLRKRRARLDNEYVFHGLIYSSRASELKLKL